MNAPARDRMNHQGLKTPSDHSCRWKFKRVTHLFSLRLDGDITLMTRGLPGMVTKSPTTTGRITRRHPCSRERFSSRQS